MIRILHITTGLELGGAERILVNCTSEAEQHGFQSRVIALKEGGLTRQNLIEKGVPVRELGASRYYPDPSALIRLVAEIRRFKPDVIQGWMYHANMFAMAATALAGAGLKSKLVWGIYNSRLELKHYDLRMRMVVRAGAHSSRWPVAIVYNSHRAAADHVAMGYRARRTLIIGNGVDLDRFRPDPARRAATRARFGLDPDAFVALAVARVDPQKDWATVLAGVARVRGMTTVAVGPTTVHLPEQTGLMKRGAELAMEEIYPAADVFILPSAFGEGTSVAMTEAMACGVPVIVTDVGDNGEFGREGGRLIPRGSPDALAAALEELRDDAALRRDLGTRARAMIESAQDEGGFHDLFQLWRKIASNRT